MRHRQLISLPALGVFLLLLSIPLFFEIFRAAAFNTAPRDDYAPYLLHILGHGGELPGSPMIYRPLSVIVAVPFAFVLPVYSFSNLTDIDPQYLRATEALAAVSYLSLLATAGLFYLMCREKLRASIKASLLVALLSFFFSAFISQTGNDPLSIFMIALLLYVLDRRWLFAALLLLSVVLNEKVVFLLAIVLMLRVLFGGRSTVLPQLIVSMVAVAGYFAIRLLVNAPGNENQIMPSTYLASVLEMLPVIFSLKGLVTNLIPTFLIAALAAIDFWALDRLRVDSSLSRKPDVLVFLVMFLMGVMIDVQYTEGRLVMFTYPLYLPMLSRCIDHWFPDSEMRTV